MDAWGVWCSDIVKKFDFRPAVANGATIAVGQMNTGYQQPNPAWGGYPVGFVQQAYEHNVPVVCAHYKLDLRHAPGVANQLYHHQYSKLTPDGALNDDNKYLRDIYSGLAAWKNGAWIPNKHVQVLIVEFGGILHPAGNPVYDEGWWPWAGTIMHHYTEYLRDNIARINPKVKRVVPMVSSHFINTYFPHLRTDSFIVNDIFVSDFNVAGSAKPLASWSMVNGMYRPPNPLDVLLSTNYRFCRWSNAAFITPDFDQPVGAADFNGSVARLSQWTGVSIDAPTPLPEPEPEPPIDPPPVVSLPDITPELADLGDICEQMSVLYMGAKHTIESILEKLEE